MSNENTGKGADADANVNAQDKDLEARLQIYTIGDERAKVTMSVREPLSNKYIIMLTFADDGRIVEKSPTDMKIRNPIRQNFEDVIRVYPCQSESKRGTFDLTVSGKDQYQNDYTREVNSKNVKEVYFPRAVEETKQ